LEVSSSTWKYFRIKYNVWFFYKVTIINVY